MFRVAEHIAAGFSRLGLGGDGKSCSSQVMVAAVF